MNASESRGGFQADLKLFTVMTGVLAGLDLCCMVPCARSVTDYGIRAYMK